ncbi:DUF4055 domain-containing protein [Shewanella fodinae]|uniref:DUF4055 domain-containing protein n=1 Tax=Shewanella fodinae TaxID=552357 RepID=UPI00167354A6|nr:DUF4055 domain-containing protein [Shewanella fodinae]MCL2905221.1 DUF4055 domain-containing protein [Shewanella fodinae]GGY87664.1 DNA-binding protein [Shewanella fodinae]
MSIESPDTAIETVNKMDRDWQIVRALLGGTRAMRDAGVKYLPKWPKEEDEAYKDRLCRSTLFPAFAETVKNMTGRVFSNGIALGDDVPANIALMCDNIDQQGNNLAVFCNEWFKLGLAFGLRHVLVDFPPTEGITTQAEEKQAGVRPYAVGIHPDNILGWRFTNGVLTQFRFKEKIETDDGEFGTAVVDQIRVLEIGKWRTFRKDEGGSWTLHGEGTFSMNHIPLVQFYSGERFGGMGAVPPLMELAHLNVTHWQSQSDQRNILHVARVPILAAVNAGDTVNPATGQLVPWEMTVGSSSAVRINGDGADLKFVEHTGKSIEAGRQDLQDLIDEMRMAGARLLYRESNAVKTAAQANEEANEKTSPLETMGNNFADAVSMMLQFFAEWTGQTEGGHVTIDGNYDIDYAPEVTLPVLRGMADNGQISVETLFEEVQRRGVLSDSIKWGDEVKRINEQRSRLDPQVLSALITAKTAGAISPESLWGYIVKGQVPDGDWTSESAKVQNPTDYSGV